MLKGGRVINYVWLVVSEMVVKQPRIANAAENGNESRRVVQGISHLRKPHSDAVERVLTKFHQDELTGLKLQNGLG